MAMLLSWKEMNARISLVDLSTDQGVLQRACEVLFPLI